MILESQRTKNRATKKVDNRQTSHDRKEQRRHNSGLAKVAVQYSADSFLVNQTLVLPINICGKNRQLLVAAKHQEVKKLSF